jgi:hypothetical protein
VREKEGDEVARIPQGVTKYKGEWGTSYFYQGIHITKGSGKYSTPYDFRVEGVRILASTLNEAVREIEKQLQKEKEGKQ